MMKITYILLVNNELEKKIKDYNLDFKVIDDNYF